MDELFKQIDPLPWQPTPENLMSVGVKLALYSCSKILIWNKQLDLLIECWVIFHAFVVVCWLFLKLIHSNILSRTLSECQTVWVQICRSLSRSKLFAKVISRCRLWQGQGLHLGLLVRKPVLGGGGGCEQHRCRPACTSAQSDQRLCFSLFEKFYM